jgi:cell division protein FtsZ
VAPPIQAVQPPLPVQPRAAAVVQPQRPHPVQDVRVTDNQEARIAELAHRLKADNARVAERVERIDRIERAEPPPPPRPAAMASQQPIAASAAASAPPRAPIDQVAAAAVAAALAPRSDEVTIRPIPPKPSLFADPIEREPAQPQPEPATPKVFIPPQPERPASRAPRMPTVEELPVPAQNEYRARRGEIPEAEHPERRRLTLLQRLAAVGLGRREDDSEAKGDGRPAEPPPAPAAERPSFRGPPRQTESRPAEPGSEYARRPAPHGLDMHGRSTQAHVPHEEDQLDIPAFLRRQAN